MNTGNEIMNLREKVLEKLRRYEGLGLRFHPTEQMRKLASAGKGFYSS